MRDDAFQVHPRTFIIFITTKLCLLKIKIRMLLLHIFKICTILSKVTKIFFISSTIKKERIVFDYQLIKLQKNKKFSSTKFYKIRKLFKFKTIKIYN